MSITLTSNAPVEPRVREESCLCAQSSGVFTTFFLHRDTSEAARQDLKKHASPDCPLCKGTGVEEVSYAGQPEINWSNENAQALFAVLGVSWEPCGSLSLPAARRAVMQAKGRPALERFTRSEGVSFSKPRVRPDGVVELRPIRCFSSSLDAKDIQERIDRFATFAEESAAKGATEISWA